MILDIEIYIDHDKDYWAQAKFLVHGYDDVLWTNNLDEAMDFLRESVEEAMKDFSLDKEGINTKTNGGIA